MFNTLFILSLYYYLYIIPYILFICVPPLTLSGVPHVELAVAGVATREHVTAHEHVAGDATDEHVAGVESDHWPVAAYNIFRKSQKSFLFILIYIYFSIYI